MRRLDRAQAVFGRRFLAGEGECRACARAEGAARRLVRNAFADPEPDLLPDELVRRILDSRREHALGLVNAVGLIASPLLAFSLGL